MTYAELFTEIAAGAVERELSRALPHDAVRKLRSSGFGALRVPREFGGAGLDLPEFFAHVVDLAAADSNVAHLLRGHFAFVEILLLRAPSAYRDGWLRAIADGAIVGNAASEQTGNTLADIQTTLAVVDGEWRLTGRKFYTTGTLYATHVYVAAGRAADDGTIERVTCVVPTDAPGVTIVDDWDGVGQRHTASGTTVFDDVVVVDPETIASYAGGAHHLGGFFQLYLVAVAAGIGRAIVDDAVAYVRPRERTFVTANAQAPRDDVQVQSVVGRLSATAFAARGAVLLAADLMATAAASNVPGAGEDPDLVDAAEIAAYQAQLSVLPSVGAAATELFEVGGASATYRTAALDRHWRNVRTVASHNPLVYKEKQVGAYELLGTSPNAAWRALWTVGPTTVG